MRFDGSRAARLIVDAASLFVPRWRRNEWRREWYAELWYAPRGALRLARGALPHAMQLLRQHWSLDMVMQDIRYGCRMLRRNPGFALVASATLALGIGATTAIFSIVNAVLWRELPYRQPHELVQLWETNPDRNWTEAECAPANVADWRRENQSFQDVAAYFGAARDAWVSNFALTGSGEPERLKGVSVTANFFSVLGVSPAFGRSFAADEEWRGKDDVVMISAGLWRRRFAGDPSIVGRSIALDGRGRTVIGVLPSEFRFNNAAIDVWVPTGWTPDTVAKTRQAHNLRVIARLKPGITLKQAQDDMHRIAADLERRYPATNTRMGVGVGPLQEWIVGPSRTALQVFFGAVAFVLLVACANVANLMLVRGAARSRELAIRSALGASSTRLIRQMLTESVLLAAIGGALGLLLADTAVRAVVAYGPESLPRLHEIHIDRAALAFTMLVTIATGLIFGIVPARQSRVREVTTSLRGAARGGGAVGSRLRHALVVAELSLSVALLVGATLLARSFMKLNDVDLGFTPDDAVSLQIVLPRSSYGTSDLQTAFVDRLLERVRSSPGVRAAGASQRAALEGFLWSSDFSVEHRPPDAFGIEVRHNELSSGYVDAIGGRIVAGRDFGGADRAGAPRTVLVNEALVRRYFSNEDPIGQRLNFDRPGPSTSPWRTIVGVVRDFREEVVGIDPRPTIYESLAVNTDLTFTLVARTALDAATMAAALRAIVHDLDPNLPVSVVQPLRARVDQALAPHRFTTTLMGLFALTGLVLATIGLYGVLSYLAAQRTHEIGVRVALGATGGDVMCLVAGQALVLTAIGVTVGIVVSLLSGRLIAGLLFGVTAYDPATYGVVLTLLPAVAMCAVLLPVRRAVRVSPLVALRSE
jgi:putative ABC transport system permease protein